MSVERNQMTKNKEFKKCLHSAEEIANTLLQLTLEKRIECINEIRMIIHGVSPFKDEPVDCVQWVKFEEVFSNDYNPNSVAPPEMKLLEHSINEDGYTQPIVAWEREEHFEVIDGFHRNRVGREILEIANRIHNHLPLAVINTNREDRNDRIASTIRHNRARGKHRIDAMAEIVIELKKRNWSDKRISKELGMDADEVLRLAQITGLAEMFADHEFSEAWEAESIDESDTLDEANI